MACTKERLRVLGPPGGQEDAGFEFLQVVRAEVHEVTNPDSGDKRVAYQYDYRGRRTEKTYQVYDGSSWVTQAGYPHQFVYDGWNVVLHITSSSTRSFTWGLDLSGTLQGAGGVGGLLSTVTNGVPLWVTHDANGNVSELIRSTGTPEVTAHYGYDPYGNLNGTQQGTITANPFRFSTKFADTELGAGYELYYYGFRYYSPRMGRWMSRDPIEEEGGLNLHNYAENNPIATVDPYGASPLASPYAADAWCKGNPCRDCWQTCLANQHLLDKKGKDGKRAGGAVICRDDGCKCACTDEQRELELLAISRLRNANLSTRNTI